MIEQIAHMTGKDEGEIRETVLGTVLYVGALLVVLILLAAWVALVIYGIVPLSIDGGGEVKVIRVSLVFAGGFAIVASYVIGLIAVTQ